MIYHRRKKAASSRRLLRRPFRHLGIAFPYVRNRDNNGSARRGRPLAPLNAGVGGDDIKPHGQVSRPVREQLIPRKTPLSDKKTSVVLATHKGRRMFVNESGERKDRQASKIKELADTLAAAGYVSLDDQAEALGLSRSTTWTILKAKHKNYGLSAAVISRVLRNPNLNSRVRIKMIEYIREKTAGSYGHNDTQLRRFIRQLEHSVGTPLDLAILDPLGCERSEAGRVYPVNAQDEEAEAS